MNLDDSGVYFCSSNAKWNFGLEYDRFMSFLEVNNWNSGLGFFSSENIFDIPLWEVHFYMFH